MMIHLYKDGRELGPYTLDEIKARLHSGTVNKSDPAATDGGTQMPLGALLGTILVDEFASPAAMPQSATAPTKTVTQKKGIAEPTTSTGKLYKNDDSNRGYTWAVIGILGLLALFGVLIYSRADNSGKGAGTKTEATPPAVADSDGRIGSDDEGKNLVAIYLRDIDKLAMGLIQIETTEKGRPYTSHGEHGIRAGLTVEPTKVIFTGWGFGGAVLGAPVLKHYGVVSTWFCFKDDYGSWMAVADQHEVGPIPGDTPARADLPQLGAIGMTAERMEELCGPAVQSSTPMPEDNGIKRMTWCKDGSDMNCLLFEGSIYSITYSRSDRTKASNTDRIVWLIQNGAHWASGIPYRCSDNGMVANTASIRDSKTGRYEGLEVTDPKVLTAHQEQAAVLAPAPLDGLHTPHPSYPYAARAKHVQGSGVCHVVFGVTGHVASAEMTRSTGSDILDNNTVEFAKANWTGAPNSSVNVPITYGSN